MALPESFHEIYVHYLQVKELQSQTKRGEETTEQISAHLNSFKAHLEDILS